MRIKFTLVFLLASFAAFAQSPKEIFKKIKDNTTKKVKEKLEKETQKSADEVVDASFKWLEKKKKGDASEMRMEKTPEKVKEGKFQEDYPGAKEHKEEQRVIKTTVLCEEGRKRVEKRLKSHKNVLEMEFDKGNGDLTIRYQLEGLTYEMLLSFITAEGFAADDQKPVAGKVSPCKS